MLQDLMVSKVRAKLLQTFLAKPKEMFYVRQLVRLTGEEINAVRQELKRMERLGMVKKESRGNRIYYWFNQAYPLYQEILAMVCKTVGLGGEILKRRSKIGNIRYALISGRLVKGLPRKPEGVDLLIIGEINLPNLANLVREEEKNLGREINYSVMTKEEFDFRKKRRDPFLFSILTEAKIMLVGEEESLFA